MANTFNLGNGNWAQKTEKLLAYNAENNNYKPLPFDFDRASTATVVNKDGLIETVGVDEPRIDFTDNTKGHLLLEPSRQNKITYSELLSNWTQDGASVADNNTISPDGTQNASKITFNSGSKRLVFTVSSTQAIYSAYFKGVSGTQIKLRNASGTIFNTITLTDEWVRYELDINASNGNVQIQSINADYVYAWGAQLEDGSYATSYIPTSGSAVTRSAETCNNAGNSTVFNDSEGVLYAEIAALTDVDGDASLRFISLSNGTSSKRITIYYFSSETFGVQLKNDGYEVTDLYIGGSVDRTQFNKIALYYSGSNVKAYLNGIEVFTNSSWIPFPDNTINTLTFTDGSLSNSPFYGKVKDVRYYNTALSDNELQALTTI